jgi:hypothetical protein
MARTDDVRSSPLPCVAGEGQGGGQRQGTNAPIPTFPRKRGKEPEISLVEGSDRSVIDLNALGKRHPSRDSDDDRSEDSFQRSNNE